MLGLKMKAKKGYRKYKTTTSYKRWFKRYFKKRTCKNMGHFLLKNEMQGE